MKLFFLLCLLGISVSFCQERPDVYMISPFKIVGDSTLSLPSGLIQVGMKGHAYVFLIIDAKCNLLDFSIYLVSISDEKRENIIQYRNNIAYQQVLQMDPAVYNKEFYPRYLHQFYEEISLYISKLKIVYSDDTRDLKETNRIVYKFSIE